MPIETTTYIDGLDANNPAGTDQIAEGDNHIRLLKSAIKSTFPNLTGAVTVTQADLNATANILVDTDLTGTPTAPTAAAGTNTTQIATTAFVLSNGVPSGGIMMWAGPVSSIPSGWVLCDGTNNTPDLRDRFVVGAGSTYTAADTGGSADAVLVSHDHPATSTSTSTSTVTDPGHNHQWAGSEYTGQYDFGQNAPLGNFASTTDGRNQLVDTSSVQTGVTVATQTTTATSVDTVGSSATNANLPPYYALAYIMKV